MNKCYYRIVWENYPSDKTPLNEQNLNKIDIAAEEMDNRIISLDSTKFDKAEAQLLVKYIEYDEDTGIFKITHYNGASYTIDTLLEKLAVNFDYDYQTQRLIIELSDGTVKYVDLSALITQYEFLDSDTVSFALSADGKIAAKVKEGSIEERHLRPNYLADIKVEAAKAQASQQMADASEKAAKKSETAAKISEEKAGASEAAARASRDAAAASASEAAVSEAVAMEKADDAAASAARAAGKAEAAENGAAAAEASAISAAESAAAAGQKAAEASNFANAAGEKAVESSGHADRSKSYAVGTNGEIREDDNSDCAKYYYEQAKRVLQGVSGIVPMGTIPFGGLADTVNQRQGYMFNISESFVSDNRFADGGGIFYGSGNNVLYTADGKWDVLAGVTVSGVKGSAETEYRQGFVNITPGNIGLGNVGNYKAVSTAASQGLSNAEKTNARNNIGAGTSSFSGNYNDLSNKPTIPTIPSSLPANGGNADTVDGFHASESAAPRTCVARDGNNYAYFNYINSNTSNNENPNISQVIVTNGSDGFYRKASIGHLKE